jgi:membrane protease YdiL (CAAX protease family)
MKRWGLAAAMVYPTVLAWCYFVALARPADSAESLNAARASNPAVVAAWVGGKALQFLIPLIWLWAVEKRIPMPQWPNFRGVSAGIGFGVVAAAGTFVLYGFLSSHTHWLADAPGRVTQKLKEFGLETAAKFLLFAAFLSVVHSFMEEYYWRWFVFRQLRMETPVVSAAFISSLAFMAYHIIDLSAFFPGKLLTMVLPLSACIAVGGLFWCWLFARTNSIYAPWLSHILIDGAIMAVGYDLAFRVG